MSTELTQQYRDLCRKLFAWEPQLTIRYQSDEPDELVAWNPVTQSTFVLWRHAGLDDRNLHALYWYPSGKSKQGGTFSDFPGDHKHHPKMIPSPAFLKQLDGALPIPQSWAWGIVKQGEIAEVVLFVQSPPVDAWIVSAQGPTTLRKELALASKRLNLEGFWKLVRAGKLQDLTPILKRARTVQSAYLHMHYLIVDGRVFCPQPAWELEQRPTLVELQSVAKDIKSRLK